MNQILVTDKVYITPELRRKKKMYRFLFIISVFLMISLCSIYIYAEFDRNKDESISQNMLLSMKEDNTTVSEYENALVVLLTQDAIENEDEIAQQDNAFRTAGTGQGMSTATTNYTASNGQTYEAIGTVSIPKLNVSYPIFSKTTDELLKVSVCKFHGCNPNEVGNLCIVGHNYRNTKFFSKVPTLEMGDIVEIKDLSKRKVKYQVYDMHTVDPNDTKDTTQYTNGKREVTLITCTNDSKQRVIVRCIEKI